MQLLDAVINSPVEIVVALVLLTLLMVVVLFVWEWFLGRSERQRVYEDLRRRRRIERDFADDMAARRRSAHQ